MNFNIYELKIEDTLKEYERVDETDPTTLIDKILLSDSGLYDNMGSYNNQGLYERQVAERRWGNNGITAFRLQKGRTKKIQKQDWGETQVDDYPYGYVVIDNREGRQLVAVEKRGDLGRTTEGLRNVVQDSINKMLCKHHYIIELRLIHKYGDFMDNVKHIRQHNDRIKSVRFDFVGKEIQHRGSDTFYVFLNELAKYTEESSLEFKVNDEKLFNTDEDNIKHLLFMQSLCKANPEYTLTAKFEKFGSYTYGTAYEAQCGMDDDLRKILTNDLSREEFQKRYSRMMHWLDLIANFYSPEKPKKLIAAKEVFGVETIIHDFYANNPLVGSLDNCYQLWLDDKDATNFKLYTLFYLVTRALDNIRKLEVETDRLSFCDTLKSRTKNYLKNNHTDRNLAEDASKMVVSIVIECLEIYDQLSFQKEITRLYNSVGDKEYVLKINKMNIDFVRKDGGSPARRWLCKYMDDEERMYGTTFISEHIASEARYRKNSQRTIELNGIVATMNFDAIEPLWLKTSDAKAAWAQLHEAGIVDSCCMIADKNMKNPDIGVLASVMAEHLDKNIRDNWNVFDALWSREGLRKAHNDKKNKSPNNYVQTRKKYKNILCH